MANVQQLLVNWLFIPMMTILKLYDTQHRVLSISSALEYTLMGNRDSLEH